MSNRPFEQHLRGIENNIFMQTQHLCKQAQQYIGDLGNIRQGD